MGRLHARVAAESDATELVAVVDPDGAGERVAWLGNAPWVKDVAELEAHRPEAAIVAVPAGAHAEVALGLIERGIPLLVEKPIADTVDDAQAIAAAAESAGVTLAVGHVERFNPAVRALRDRLAENQIGRVFQVHTQRLSPFPSRIGDAGVSLDMATHDLDLMCVLAGKPQRVSAEVQYRSQNEREDLLAATLRFDSGIVGLLEVNWLTPTKVRRLSVTGEGGMFVVDYLNQHLTLYENAEETKAWFSLDVFSGVTEGNVTRYAIHRVEPLRAQLESFVAAVRGEAPVEVTAADGLRALRLALAVVEAGRLGHTLELGE
jgi:predicted dehydrogenase